MTPSMVLNRYQGAGIVEVVTDTYKDDEGQYKPMNLLRARALEALSEAAGEESIPRKVLRRVVQMQRRAINSDQEGEDSSTQTVGKWTVGAIAGAAGRFALKLVTTVMTWTLRAAKSLIWTVGRFLLRSIVVPVLSGLGAILSSPVGLGVTAVLGTGVLGYFLYRSFFKGDDPNTVDKGGEGFTSQDDSEDSWWGRIFGPSAQRSTAYGTGTSQYGVGATADRLQYSGGVASEKETANAEKILQTKRSSTVAGAIREASRVTGVDESILNAIAYKESTFNPTAKAPTSTAKGLFQFLDGTWKLVVNQYGARYGVPKDANPFDPLSSAIMGGAYLKHEIYPQISKVRPNPNATDLYLGHFMGPVGGRNWLRNMMNNPNGIAANDFPVQAKANQWVYWDKGTGRARTYAEIYDVFSRGLRGIESAINKSKETPTSTSVTPVESTPMENKAGPPVENTVTPQASAMGAVGQQGAASGAQAAAPNYIKYKGMAVAVS